MALKKAVASAGVMTGNLVRAYKTSGMARSSCNALLRCTFVIEKQHKQTNKTNQTFKQARRQASKQVHKQATRQTNK